MGYILPSLAHYVSRFALMDIGLCPRRGSRQHRESGPRSPAPPSGRGDPEAVAGQVVTAHHTIMPTDCPRSKQRPRPVAASYDEDGGATGYNAQVGAGPLCN